jgi:flotillin
MPPFIAIALLALIATALLIRSIARLLIVAQPDEWLLRIRNGRLVRAGVGIYLLRWPGDVVVRFTSTMQRVSFEVDALSSDRLRVAIGGFILWSVAGSAEGPFRAYQKLGLVSLDSPPSDTRSPKHLLSTPQHRAFQQLLGAAVQRLAGTRSLEELLLRQDDLVAELRGRLAELEREMGIRVDQVELLRVRPTDEDLTREMAAKVEERVREEAASARLEAQERGRRRAIESEDRVACEQAESRRQELERERVFRLAQLEHEREVQARQQAILHERALAEEAGALEIAKEVQAREELQLMARLDRVRREAEASRDAISAVTDAEERKSQNVRDHELARLVAEKVGDALKGLPLQEARWITVGPDSPAGSLAALISAVGEVTGLRAKKAA